MSPLDADTLAYLAFGVIGVVWCVAKLIGWWQRRR